MMRYKLYLGGNPNMPDAAASFDIMERYIMQPGCDVRVVNAYKRGYYENDMPPKLMREYLDEIRSCNIFCWMDGWMDSDQSFFDYAAAHKVVTMNPHTGMMYESESHINATIETMLDFIVPALRETQCGFNEMRGRNGRKECIYARMIIARIAADLNIVDADVAELLQVDRRSVINLRNRFNDATSLDMHGKPYEEEFAGLWNRIPHPSKEQRRNRVEVITDIRRAIEKIEK